MDYHVGDAVIILPSKIKGTVVELRPDGVVVRIDQCWHVLVRDLAWLTSCPSRATC